MEGIVCDGCGEGLLLQESVRYVVKLEGYAAYDPLELTRQDVERDLTCEFRGVLEELENLEADAAQDQVHRSFQFDLCGSCWRRYVKDPLRGLPRTSDDRRPGPQDGPSWGGEEEGNEKGHGD